MLVKLAPWIVVALTVLFVFLLLRNAYRKRDHGVVEEKRTRWLAWPAIVIAVGAIAYVCANYYAQEQKADEAYAERLRGLGFSVVSADASENTAVVNVPNLGCTTTINTFTIEDLHQFVVGDEEGDIIVTFSNDGAGPAVDGPHPLRCL